MEDGFATVSRDMAKAIFEVFIKSVKADLEVSYDEEIQGENILTTRSSPREVEAVRGCWQKPEVYSCYRF